MATLVVDTGEQTLTNKTLTSPVLNTGVSGTAVLDEDAMGSDSATKIATQQSIKKYVDDNAGSPTYASTAETTTGTETAKTVTPNGLHDMTSLSGATWMLDEDAMGSDSATKIATQQSIKKYVDSSFLVNQIFN